MLLHCSQHDLTIGLQRLGCNPKCVAILLHCSQHERTPGQSGYRVQAYGQDTCVVVEWRSHAVTSIVVAVHINEEGGAVVGIGGVSISGGAVPARPHPPPLSVPAPTLTAA